MTTFLEWYVKGGMTHSDNKKFSSCTVALIQNPDLLHRVCRAGTLWSCDCSEIIWSQDEGQHCAHIDRAYYFYKNMEHERSRLQQLVRDAAKQSTAPAFDENPVRPIKLKE